MKLVSIKHNDTEFATLESDGSIILNTSDTYINDNITASIVAPEYDGSVFGDKIYLLKDGVGITNFNQYYTYSKPIHDVAINPPMTSPQATMEYSSNGYLVNRMRGYSYGHTTTLSWDVSGLDLSHYTKLNIQVLSEVDMYRHFTFGTANNAGTISDYELISQHTQVYFGPSDVTTFTINNPTIDNYVLFNLCVASVASVGDFRLYNVWLD